MATSKTQNQAEALKAAYEAIRVKEGMYYIPRYMGFKPQHNLPSRTAFIPRTSEKANMLPYDLDQYSRGLWPHYKGFKPQAFSNIREKDESGSRQTTYGYNNYIVQRERNTLRSQSVPSRRKNLGVKSFFSAGSSDQLTSTNGTAMAETFYQHTRPMEGSLLNASSIKPLPPMI